MRGYQAIAKVLLKKDDELEIKDSTNNWTPHLWAAIGGNKTVVKLLLEKDIGPETKNSSDG